MSTRGADPSDADLARRETVRRAAWIGPLLLVATIAGLVVVASRASGADLHAFADALARIGVATFVGYCVYSVAVNVLLGAGWLAMLPGHRWRMLGALSWARMVREAASDLLPFSQVGGVVLAFRLLLRRGLAPSSVYASFAADLGIEMASQLVFTLAAFSAIGSWSTLAMPGGPALEPMIVAVALAVILIALFGLQRALMAFGPTLVSRLPSGGADAQATIDALRAAYARPVRVAAGFAANLAAWIASASGAWLVLRAAGFDAPFRTVIAIESVVFAVRAVAFVVPAGIGVQEATYAILFPHLGLPIEAALVVALVKRARDLAVGLPTIVLWQWQELRGWVGARHRDAASGRTPVDATLASTERAGRR